MNRRQKKKFWKNHLLLINTQTGNRHLIKVDDFMKLAQIADLTEVEIKKILDIEEIEE
jgi:hypothetical protein